MFFSSSINDNLLSALDIKDFAVVLLFLREITKLRDFIINKAVSSKRRFAVLKGNISETSIVNGNWYTPEVNTLTFLGDLESFLNIQVPKLNMIFVKENNLRGIVEHLCLEDLISLNRKSVLLFEEL